MRAIVFLCRKIGGYFFDYLKVELLLLLLLPKCRCETRGPLLGAFVVVVIVPDHRRRAGVDVVEHVAIHAFISGSGSVSAGDIVIRVVIVILRIQFSSQFVISSQRQSVFLGLLQKNVNYISGPG